MRIIGLDIGRSFAVAVVLTEFPVNILKTYRQVKSNKGFYKLPTSAAGVDKLLWLAPDAIVLEPTGYWYSQFWATVAQKHNIAVYWVGHVDLDKLRGNYGFVNKRDEEDALCLAACYFDDRFIDIHGDKRFIKNYRAETVARIRELFLAKEQLAKLRTNLIAQIRQRLSFEFPEAAKHQMEISSLRGFTPIIGWLAEVHHFSLMDNKYRASVAPKLEIEISDYTRQHAMMLVEIERRITQTYDELERAIVKQQFEPYIKVFDRFGFGIDNKALLLYHCYPLNKFLVNNKPWIEYEQSKGKLQKRDRSLRKFQSYLGTSYKFKNSGESKVKKLSGSTMVRSHLYVWAVCQIAPYKKGYKIKNKIGHELSDRYQELRKSVKGKDSLMRILFKTTRKLFYELVKELC